MNTNMDVYTRITEEIIKKIESGAKDFQMPWYNTKDGTLLAPVNAKTGNNYKGINIVSLWVSGITSGYSKGLWATYKQWAELGAQVRKGEKASLIVFYKPFNSITTKDEVEQEEESKTSSSKHLMARTSFVFNVEQVDNYSQPPDPIFNLEDRIEGAENFFSSLNAVIEHRGNRACYVPSLDKIEMPKFEVFRDANSYYATLAHEFTHWTGHTSRCNRDLTGRFGTSSYAAEELVAELGAAFLCSFLGLNNQPREDHASYIASWLTLFKGDKKAIFTAASKAQEALDWLQQRHSQATQQKAA
jgi:antirestriction protein ArdC